MGRSQNTFNKKQKEKNRLQKRKAKQERKEERKANAQAGTLENMMAYVDENGNILDSPPDSAKEEVDASEIEIGIPKQEDERNVARRGRVTYFDHSKGYGFINQDGSQERFFVHMNSLKEPINEGDKVAFKAQKGLKGMDAIEVSVVR